MLGGMDALTRKWATMRMKASWLKRGMSPRVRETVGSQSDYPTATSDANLERSHRSPSS